MTDAPAENPVLAAWTGPHGGGPVFDKIQVEHFAPALDDAIARYRAEIAAIANNPEAPTFANTLEALERSGRDFRQATSLMSIFTSTLNTPAMQAVQRAAAPRLAAFRDEIMHNRALFDRIGAVFETRETAGLNAEQQRLADVVMRRFTRQGAALAPAEKNRLAEINQRLASLYTAFSQNILADEEGLALVLDDEADLAGLPPEQVQAAASAAEQRGLSGKWVIPNTRSSMDPFITLSERRDLRRKALEMWASRGDNPGDHDNNPIIAEILKLRVEKARLLGFASFAHWIADGQMAKTPDAAMDLLRQKGAAFEEISLDGDRAAQAAMSAKAGGRSTVPQIFFDDRHIGGCDELYELSYEGQLDALLAPR